jgi:uncharacterized protein
MSPVFILPGWLNSGPTHWQSRWEALHGYHRVLQHDWVRPLRGDWMARLEEELLSNKERLTQSTRRLEGDLPYHTGVLLVAHSLGCHLVAAWAAISHNTHLVRGALLVAPPDVSREDLPADMHNWRRPVLTKLPFPAICVVSSNDPFGSLEAGQATAQAWGARCVEAGPLGHINGESGLGDWPAGHQLLLDLGGSQI